VIIGGNENMPEQLLNLASMARVLGVPKQWLRDEADAERVPCLRAGDRYLFAPSAVERVLAERAAQSGEVKQ
jgi:hypothetical protein